MIEAKTKTVEEEIAELEAQREDMRKAYFAARKAQYALDLKRVIQIENEHSFGRTIKFDLNGWKEGVGAATLVVARVPDSRDALYKRFEQTAYKAKAQTTQGLDAGHQLAESCIVYPSKRDEPDLYEATLELAAGILTHIANEVAEAVRAAKGEEKKE